LVTGRWKEECSGKLLLETQGEAGDNVGCRPARAKTKRERRFDRGQGLAAPASINAANTSSKAEAYVP